MPTSAVGPAFCELPLSPATLATLEQLGYLCMTPIQAASLPLTLAGHDLIAQAKSGSGKTAAFALSLLARVDPASFAVQALVLCPTRELAEQVREEVRRLARGMANLKILALCGGTNIRRQLTSLAHGAHVVVGTPGRLLDHLARGSLTLDGLRTLVLDEADRMLDMGFADDIGSVVARCPATRQTLLFSATFPEPLVELGRRLLRSPRLVKLPEQHAPGQIRQRYYEVQEDQRLEAVTRLLDHYRPERTLAFCNTKQQCRDLLEVLQARGFVALTLHGELEQYERDSVLLQFANRSCSVLVATDVAARGIDIAQLDAVINVEVSPDPDVHLHRIGRTGRADEDGWALSLASKRDRERVERIEESQGTRCEWHPLSGLSRTSAEPLVPPMVTLLISGGRKEKIRPGDVLGALTAGAGFRAEQVGKISVSELSTTVAVERGIAALALAKLSVGKLKGRSVKARIVRGVER